MAPKNISRMDEVQKVYTSNRRRIYESESIASFVDFESTSLIY